MKIQEFVNFLSSLKTNTIDKIKIGHPIYNNQLIQFFAKKMEKDKFQKTGSKQPLEKGIYEGNKGKKEDKCQNKKFFKELIQEVKKRIQSPNAKQQYRQMKQRLENQLTDEWKGSQLYSQGRKKDRSKNNLKKGINSQAKKQGNEQNECLEYVFKNFMRYLKSKNTRNKGKTVIQLFKEHPLEKLKFEQLPLLQQILLQNKVLGRLFYELFKSYFENQGKDKVESDHEGNQSQIIQVFEVIKIIEEMVENIIRQKEEIREQSVKMEEEINYQS